ncbi:hypothetical protein TRICI_005577 [Trichomonascus ciferrii]|uniref:Uncharacterized protein n=1 Tax=Trichomonascus ciferrii TaxID=44093 RepID=A0A642US21_9ASCO|nr:hypothetical protein TRICI_005577 [Trichomonascus ciferrii]
MYDNVNVSPFLKDLCNSARAGASIADMGVNNRMIRSLDQLTWGSFGLERMSQDMKAQSCEFPGCLGRSSW